MRRRPSDGLTQASIAKATGATVRSVRNRRETSAIRPRSNERPRELREIVLLLRETLTPPSVRQWLTARNRIPGGRRPIEVLAEGHAKAVRDAAKALMDRIEIAVEDSSRATRSARAGDNRLASMQAETLASRYGQSRGNDGEISPNRCPGRLICVVWRERRVG